jgi:hypothetical protein
MTIGSRIPVSDGVRKILSKELRLRMLDILGWFIVAVACVLGAVNGFFMVVSPRAWLRLPNWIRTPGFWFEANCANDEGAIQARLTGALLLALVVLVLYASLLGRTILG